MKTHMDLKLLREFIVLARTCNYQEAAELLFISQSSLSKHIHHLEAEIGVPLFERTTRSVRLSEYGDSFNDYAQRIIKLYDEFGKSVTNIRSHKENNLSVGFMPMVGHYGIVELLAIYAKEHPNVNLNMVEQKNTSDLMEQLSSEKCEAIFTAQYIKNDPNSCKLLYKTDDLVVLFPKDHPMANRESVTFSQLRDLNFIMHSSAPMEAEHVRQLCAKAGFEPKVIMTISFSTTITRLVSQGIGICVLNRMQLSDENYPGITMVRIDPPSPFNIYVLYLKKNKRHYATADFLNYVKSQSDSK